MSSAISAVQTRLDAHWAGKQPWQVCRDTLLLAGAAWALVKVVRAVRKKGVKKALLGGALSLVKATPAGRAAVAQENAKIIAKLRDIMRNPHAEGEAVLTTIPAQGEDKATLLKRLQKWQAVEVAHWSEGQVSGGVYHGGQELVDFLNQVYGLFALSNPLHTEVFPFVRKMEAEVVRMTVSLFRGDDKACGTMTSGGTESILMAMKAYRDHARAMRGISPEDATSGDFVAEIVAPASAHAAFDKAAHYFGMKIVHVPVDPLTMRADVKAMEAAITPNTVVLVGSAPGFPHGVVDPISELASLAKSRGIGMHVDGCLGGYLLPFVVQLGYEVPAFDFSVEGVTSISADTHKYGYAPKGASVVMYRDTALRSCQYFVAPEWSGGIYASPSMPGSRPGGLIAATWAALVCMGQKGYLECAREIMKTAKEIEVGIRQIKGLRVLGNPHMSVISFSHDDTVQVRGATINIYKVGEALGAKKKDPLTGQERPGWNLNTLQKPSSIHLCCTYMHRNRAAEFLKDLQAAVDLVADNPNMFKNGSAAIYGMAESLPDGSVIEDMARGFIDTLYAQ